MLVLFFFTMKTMRLIENEILFMLLFEVDFFVAFCMLKFCFFIACLPERTSGKNLMLNSFAYFLYMFTCKTVDGDIVNF